MKTKEEIEKRLEWCKQALEDEDNQMEAQQIKLWAEINLLRWILEKE